MLGRHNITLYADELERCIGQARRLVKETENGNETCYWLGVLNALQLLYRPDMPDDNVAMISALKLHFGADEESD